MTKSFALMFLLSQMIILNACRTQPAEHQGFVNDYQNSTEMIQSIVKTDEEWFAELGAEKFSILRMCSTEPPFSGKYVHHKAAGTYVCGGCGTALFSSETKYDSQSGWPSFFNSLDDSKINKIKDTSFGMIRTEIKCAKCNGHLGHLFPDGPKPTGLRYCVNSGSLDFIPATND